MKVLIDGIHYVPFRDIPRIGIAITTHNRNDILSQALSQHHLHLPTGAYLVIVDDGSTQPVSVPDGVKLIRHEKSLGIVAAKNASLAALMDACCEHLFLWDDDAWPIADDWHQLYIDSPEPHLAYQFLDLAGPRKINDMIVLYRDSQHIAYTGQRGVMLYYHRSAIEKVGGFDPVYGRGMYEHADLALRIHNAGLTTWAYADVIGSEKWIHSLDEHESVERSVPQSERESQAAQNAVIYHQRHEREFTDYVEYRPKQDVVITTLLTSQPDPQRGVRMPASPDLLRRWATSIYGGKPIVLADELKIVPREADLYHVSALEMSPYFARWLHIYRHLRQHPEYRFVWCTDGTDVEMLHAPWDEMIQGKIYVGSEPKTYADDWVKQYHQEQVYQNFIKAHYQDTLLNSGLLGGSRKDVMEIAHGIIRLFYRIESDRFWKKEKSKLTRVDMLAFCMIVSKFSDRVVTGPQVHTVFKTEGIGKEIAWFRHK